MTRTKRSPVNHNIVPSQGSVEGGGLSNVKNFAATGCRLTNPSSITLEKASHTHVGGAASSRHFILKDKDSFAFIIDWHSVGIGWISHRKWTNGLNRPP